MGRAAASGDWSVVGESRDPTPGDPQEVAAIGRELRLLADAIERQAGEIEALAGVEGWQSIAAAEFRAEADGAAGRLRKAFVRYDTAARVMGTSVKEWDDGCPHQDWASELARAQRVADTALREAEEADAERRTASNALECLTDDVEDDDPERTGLENRVATAGETVARCRTEVERAKEIHREGASRAAAAIREVITTDGLKDSRWERFREALTLQNVAKWAGRIAAVAGTFSLFLGWVPFLGQALIAITLIAGVVSLACNLTLAIRGEGSWLDVALDVVGLATFGIGAAVLRSGRLAVQGIKATARREAYKAAQRTVPNREIARTTAKKMVPDAVTGQKISAAIGGMPPRRLSFLPMPRTPNNALTWPARLDPDIRTLTNELRRIDPKVFREPATGAAVQNFNSQVAAWWVSTGTGTAAGWWAFGRTFN
ncbi:hypothetical protein [Streptomyces alkaliphilus]|uniref:hypothetical protein n=1 Tax=Streptomyces alkaliphilus TaxID=1472722 RepID=UPI00117F29CB|nr:hypothetical protein [Streptomyces alkaliphilus]MQS06301.1 hypothetical protein [Streptomyces alkaliphilus]